MHSYCLGFIVRKPLYLCCPEHCRRRSTAFGNEALLQSRQLFLSGHGWSHSSLGRVGFICPHFLHLKFASAKPCSLVSCSLLREGNASCDSCLLRNLGEDGSTCLEVPAFFWL